MGRKLAVVAIVLLVLLLAGGVVARRLLDKDAIRAAVERQATAAVGQPVQVRDVEWTLAAFPRVVLRDVRIGAPPAAVFTRVELTTGLRALFSKRVEHGGVAVSGGHVDLPLPFPIGRGAAAPAPAAAESGGFLVVSVDRISVRDLEVRVAGERVALELDSALDGDRLVVSHVRMASDATAVSGSGEMTSLAARRGAFALAATTLDLDELLAIASGVSASGAAPGASASSAPPSAVTPLDMRVEVTAERGRALGLEFTSLATTLSMSRAGVVLDPLRVEAFGGRASGRARADTAGEAPVVSLAARLEGLDVARLASAAGSAGAITGTLGGDLRVVVPFGAGDALRHARGTAVVTITDGAMPGLDLVRPIVTAFGTSGAISSGERGFSSVSATFSLADGVLRTDDLAMRSRDVDLRGQGTVRVESATVDFAADLVLSEDLSAQAGRDLYRYTRESSRIVLPATVRGPLTSPTVFVDVNATLRRGLRNAVEDEIGKRMRRLFKW